MGRGVPASDPRSGGEHQVNRADHLAIALLFMALALGLSVAAHRLSAEMAYAASLGDQRPPIPQVMPGTLASEGQSRFLPMPGTRYARQPIAETGQDVGSTPTASTIYGRVPDSTDGRTDGSRRTARPQQGKLHNRQPGGNASGGLAVSAGGATAFLRASAPGARPGTSRPDACTRKGWTPRRSAYASGTKPANAGRNQRSAISGFKATRGAGEFREGK